MTQRIEPDTVKGPFENPLKKFSTMTYSISIYLQSPEHYKQMMNNNEGIKTMDGLSLILQSGGIKNNSLFGATRSRFFDQDFYIENTEFKSLISGTSTGAPHNTFELNFNIVEPMGLTFLEKLNFAIQEYNKSLGISDSDINFISQTYLMVVRFYGYDENGNMIRNESSDTSSRSDITSSFEKFIPFMFTGITFRLESDKIVYSCNAVCPQTQIATDKIHGTLPKNMNLQGQTLEDLFTGKNSLVQTLNKHQQKLKDEGKQCEADVYAVEFQDGSKLAKSTVIQPGTTLHARTGYPDIKTAADKLRIKSKVDKNSRTYAANAGMKISHFIDLTIRTSTFISDQYTQVHDTNKDNTSVLKEKNDNKLVWFKINHRINVLKYDKKRGKFAYKITFVISEYPVNSIDSSPYINNKECFNVAKAYDFWFTGKNTEVLDFYQDYNFLYYTSFGAKKVNDPSSNDQIINGRTMAYQVNSREPGQENSGSEEAANAASILYSPADQANARITIVGDPDWIAQSELFYPVKSDTIKSITKPDGSIDYDTAEIFFSVNYNTVVDYDLQTGLADVTAKNVGKDPLSNPGGVSQYSLIYRANTITTQLLAGEFTQELEGTIKFIPESCTVDGNKNKKKEETRVDTDKTKTATEKAANNSNGRIV